MTTMKPCPKCHSTEHLHIGINEDYMMGFILALIVFVMRKALKTEGDEAWGYDKPFVVVVLTAFGLVALVIFGCFAIDAVTHLAVPQVAMINDMLEMVQQ